MQRITGEVAKKSYWSDIWESLKNEWRKSSFWGKFTFTFKASWAIVVLGFTRRLIGLVVFATVSIALILVALIGLLWWVLGGGYNAVLHPVPYVWVAALSCYFYLRHRYPGKYANIGGGRGVSTNWIRKLPFLVGISFTVLWYIYTEAIRALRAFAGLALWKVALALAIAVFVVVSVVLIYKKYSGQQQKGEVQTKALGVLKALGIGCLITLVFNGLLFLGLPLWEKLWEHQRFFWEVNLSLALAIAMFFVKGKDDKAPGWSRKLAWIFMTFAGLGLLSTTWNQVQANWGSTGSSIISRTPVNNLSHSVPMEIALPIIADCESGGGAPGAAHQFKTDKDGKIALDEKGNKIPLKNLEGSSAIGKYQILASDHEERAKKMGFDIRTEEGNEAYARVLYQESGTKHWEVDPRGKICWEPKLRAYTWGRGEAVSFVVLAPVGKPSGPIPNAHSPKQTEIESFGKKYLVIWNGEVKEELPRPKGAEIKRPEIVRYFQLQAIGSEPVPITLKIY